jgi:hypothetical protein
MKQNRKIASSVIIVGTWEQASFGQVFDIVGVKIEGIIFRCPNFTINSLIYFLDRLPQIKSEDQKL